MYTCLKLSTVQLRLSEPFGFPNIGQSPIPIPICRALGSFDS